MINTTELQWNKNGVYYIVNKVNNKLYVGSNIIDAQYLLEKLKGR